MDNIVDRMKDAMESVKAKMRKPLMNKINSMRAKLCWTRHDLWNHLECIRFLGINCMKGRTGQGVCEEFRDAMKSRCENDEDSKLREKFCKIAKKLNILTEGADEEKEEEEASEEAEEEREEEEQKRDAEAGEEAEEQQDREEQGEPVQTAGAKQDGAPDGPDPGADEDGHAAEESGVPANATERGSGGGVGDTADPGGGEGTHPEDLDKAEAEAEVEGEAIADRDGDGVPDGKDAFPDDPSEWGDLDGDGIGDNADPDRDGDGVPNGEDTHPEDPARSVPDRDGDGVPDSEDAFPDDPAAWRDSDGDGVGDQQDPDPHDPECWEAPCGDGSAQKVAPGDLNKAEKALPAQGYDEHSPGPDVEHDDLYTWTGDWRTEWPRSSETEEEAITRICKKNPRNVWCEQYKRRQKFAR